MLSLESVLGFRHRIAKGGDCKVEFYQPSCWLYSMPNLLIFQQLVTLYLGGILVRVVSEIVWRIIQDCAKKQGLTAGSHRWLAACKPPECCTRTKMPKVEESRQLLHYKKKVPGWPGRLLVTWTHDSTQSRCQVTRTTCLGKNNFSHSFSSYYIYTLIPMILKELPERILREKP